MAEGNILESEKLKHAREWLYAKDTKYPRLAFMSSGIAVLIAATALGVSYFGAENARKAERAWVGPTTIRLSQSPSLVEKFASFLNIRILVVSLLQMFSTYQIPTLFNREMTRDVADRANRYIDRCKASNPGITN